MNAPANVCPGCKDGVAASILRLFIEKGAATVPAWASDGAIAKQLHIETEEVRVILEPIRGSTRGIVGWDL